jgi:hypothetical protein
VPPQRHDRRRARARIVVDDQHVSL